jgi:hypothetical protein
VTDPRRESEPVHASALAGHTRESFTIDRDASPVDTAHHDVLKGAERRRRERAKVE